MITKPLFNENHEFQYLRMSLAFIKNITAVLYGSLYCYLKKISIKKIIMLHKFLFNFIFKNVLYDARRYDASCIVFQILIMFN